MNGRLWFAITMVTAALGCGDGATDGNDDGMGDDGDGPSVSTDPLCGVETQDDGSKLITCDDGTTAVVRDGADGMDGASCSVKDNGDGTRTISCAAPRQAQRAAARPGGLATALWRAQRGVRNAAGRTRDALAPRLN